MSRRPEAHSFTRSLARRAPLVVCALALLVGLPLALPLFGCGGSQGRTASTSGGSGVRGAVTLENHSQFSICSETLVYEGGYDAKEVEVAPGGSVQIDVQGDTNRLFLTECGGQRSLLGHPMNWLGSAQGPTELLQGLAHDRIVVYDPGQAPENASDHRAVALNPRSISEWIFFTPNADVELAAELHAALVATAQREGWHETFEFSLPLGEWGALRNRRTGIITGRSVQAAGFARWADGHCTMQAFGFEQGYDGSDYSGPIRVGASTQLDIPCAALTYAAGLPGASPNAASGTSAVASRGPSQGASSGGGCSNTCRTANDGECDDGGPRSLYAVCTLGTDCADCGAR